MNWLKNLYKRYQYWRYGPYRIGDLVVDTRLEGQIQIIIQITEIRKDHWYNGKIIKTTRPDWNWLYRQGTDHIISWQMLEKTSLYVEETKEQRLLKKIKQLETNFKERKGNVVHP